MLLLLSIVSAASVGNMPAIENDVSAPSKYLKPEDAFQFVPSFQGVSEEFCAKAM